MKRFITGFPIIIAGILILNALLPWWSPVPWIILIVYLLRMRIKEGVITGGISLALVWTVMAVISYSRDDANMLTKTALILGGLNVVWLFILTFLISFTTGALSGWTGGAIGNLRDTRRGIQ